MNTETAVSISTSSTSPGQRLAEQPAAGRAPGRHQRDGEQEQRRRAAPRFRSRGAGGLCGPCAACGTRVVHRALLRVLRDLRPRGCHQRLRRRCPWPSPRRSSAAPRARASAEQRRARRRSATMCWLPAFVATAMPTSSLSDQIWPTSRTQASPEASVNAFFTSAGRLSQRAWFIDTWKVVVPKRVRFGPSIWYLIMLLQLERRDDLPGNEGAVDHLLGERLRQVRHRHAHGRCAQRLDDPGAGARRDAHLEALQVVGLAHFLVHHLDAPVPRARAGTAGARPRTRPSGTCRTSRAWRGWSPSRCWCARTAARTLRCAGTGPRCSRSRSR